MSKKEAQNLKKPDWYIEHMGRVWKWGGKNKNPLIGLAVSLAVALGAIALWQQLEQKREEKAQISSFEVEKKYRKIKESFDRFEADSKKAATKDNKVADKDADDPNKPEAKKPSENLEVDYGDVVKGFEEVVKENSGTKASVWSAIQLAKIYIDYKHFDAAIDVLKKVEPAAHKAGILQALALMQLGFAQEAKGDCTAAIGSWQIIADKKEFSFLQSDALLKSAVCQETLKNNQKAEELYQRILKDHAETAAARSAKKFLRLLKSNS